jgi:hypothetical protein
LDEKAKLLDTLPGIAPYTALFLSSAFDNVDRFPESKHASASFPLSINPATSPSQAT